MVISSIIRSRNGLIVLLESDMGLLLLWRAIVGELHLTTGRTHFRILAESYFLVVTRRLGEFTAVAV
jgi:hypothetical protein